MKVLIIGYGSAGKRHHRLLSKIPIVRHISIITQHATIKESFKTLEEVDDIKSYDYFIIASETHLHFKQLFYLNQTVENKLILCEKPLFSKAEELGEIQNRIYIAYQLRYHPVFNFLRKELKHQAIITAHFYCGLSLPLWRPERKYQDSYSAHRSKGGGVLLDLSHELDLAQWLCGTISKFKAFSGKYSNLEISSDDLLEFIGKTEHNSLINISLDYISKIPKREILIHTHENTYDINLIKSQIQINEKFINIQPSESDKMTQEMHLNLLNHESKTICCTYKEAIITMKLIENIMRDHLE